MTKFYLIALLVLLLILLSTSKIFKLNSRLPVIESKSSVDSSLNFSPPIAPSFPVSSLPESKILAGGYQVFQTFNNCGPASLSMALSYFGISKSQQELGQEIRPYQNLRGDNDDKSVTLDELAENVKKYNLVGFHRPNGNIQILKQFIAQGLPVIVRTQLHKGEDIGHYRVIKGYDSASIIQDDSFQGKNLKYSLADFNEIWQKFNYEYLVLVPKDKVAIVENILGPDLDLKTAWTNAVELSKKELVKNPDDIYARFNLSVAYYNIGDFQNSVNEFEKVESRLPFRTLWYQIEPIESYYELGNYNRVFQITDRILNNANRAYSEAYMLRGQSDLKLGDTQAARAEFEKAVFYNSHFASKIPVF